MRVEKMWAGWGFYGQGATGRSNSDGPERTSTAQAPTRDGIQSPVCEKRMTAISAWEPTSGFGEEQGPVRVRCETSVRRQESGTSVTEVTP